MSYPIINIESGMPTAEVALARLSQGMRNAKASKAFGIKVIHGYGSSGKGGVIKSRLLQLLTEKKREGSIRDFIRGEDFSPFSAGARQAIESCPSLSKDKDYARGNMGITIILF